MSFALSVVQVKKRDGSIEGCRCTLIEYTEQVIVSDKEGKGALKKKLTG